MHLLQTYVLPVMVYGLDVLLPRKVLIDKIEKLFRKFLKMILSLPDRVADPAVYIISGTIPIEGVIHKRALNLYGGICRLGEDSVEKQLARRQLSVKSFTSNSWFVAVKRLLQRYKLPDSWELLDNPPSKLRWKKMVKQYVDGYWVEQIKYRARLYSSLRYIHVEDYQPGKRHPCIQYVTSVRDIPRVNTKVKLVTGTYILQSNRSAFNQNDLSPLCLLCREDDETVEHFLLHCPVLASTRRVLLDDLMNTYENLFHEQPDSNSLLQFILDSGSFLSPDTEHLPQLRLNIEKTSRCLCQRLHAARFQKLSLVPQRKRKKKK